VRSLETVPGSAIGNVGKSDADLVPAEVSGLAFGVLVVVVAVFVFDPLDEAAGTLAEELVEDFGVTHQLHPIDLFLSLSALVRW
jgi:hypothetical protein